MLDVVLALGSLCFFLCYRAFIGNCLRSCILAWGLRELFLIIFGIVLADASIILGRDWLTLIDVRHYCGRVANFIRLAIADEGCDWFTFSVYGSNRFPDEQLSPSQVVGVGQPGSVSFLCYFHSVSLVCVNVQRS